MLLIVKFKGKSQPDNMTGGILPFFIFDFGSNRLLQVTTFYNYVYTTDAMTLHGEKKVKVVDLDAHGSAVITLQPPNNCTDARVEVTFHSIKILIICFPNTTSPVYAVSDIRFYIHSQLFSHLSVILRLIIVSIETERDKFSAKWFIT